MPDEKKQEGAALAKGEIVGLLMFVFGLLLGFAGLWRSGVGFLLFFFSVFMGLIIASRASAKKKGKKPAFVLTYLAPFLGTFILLAGIAAFQGEKPAAPPTAPAAMPTPPVAQPAQQAAPASAPAPAVAPTPAAPAAAPAGKPMPPAEKAFCDVMDSFGKQYADAKGAGANELKLSKLRSERRKAIQKLATKATNWTGVLEQMETNGEGKAIVGFKLPCDAEVKVLTYNNALSDVFYNTMIPQSSKVYDAIADLRKGQEVKFSGAFVVDGDKPADHIVEISVTEHGAMTEPEWLFRFAAVSP